ncbi:MAG: Fis family transcriptional regulator [Nitrospinae bacterium CG11_big_fil_rev_8_21_14_0_20_45_15]|nr:MAG: Fis family transcriptional regulator [Nitrospinae bacterium CG11_big_fil_rev_8_21_14_0_20_45_15]
MSSILVVDDERSLREFLTIMLEEQGYEVETAADGDSAIRLIKEKSFDLALTDIRMRKSNGLDVLTAVKQWQPNTPVVMMTAYATAETAVEAMKKGAYDYLSKPFQVEDLQIIIKNAIEKKKLADENDYLKTALGERYHFSNMVGKSSAMQKIFGLIQKVSASVATVLITGESGTGKELAAKAIHFSGERRNCPFISINCGALPESLLEGELFGFEKGAFTGADYSKPGLIESANLGTFFLDEIGEASPSTQVKLLRVLQEKEVMRLGSSQPIKVDVRFMAATNCDLSRAVQKKEFREDLFYRLNVVPIHIPPLRDRKEDLPFLIEHFLNIFTKEHKSDRPIQGVSHPALARMEAYHWPGNIRELSNAIERAVVLEAEDKIQLESLPDEIIHGHSAVNEWIPPLDQEGHIQLEATLDQIERRLLQSALDKTGGMINKAADMLDLSFRSMRYRIQKHKLKGKYRNP